MEDLKKTLIEILTCTYISIWVVIISFITYVNDTTALTNNKVALEEPRLEDVIQLPHENIVVKVIEKPKTQKELIDNYAEEIALNYNLDPYLIKSIIHQESRYNPNARNGKCLGLMQMSTRWHSNRAAKLGVTNFHDPYGNILLGADYLSELFKKYKDPRLVLMLYNMDNKTALKLYKEGKISNYAKTVLKRAEEYKKGE
jgi:soluble lytic murein transglycosylase-like protein